MVDITPEQEQRLREAFADFDDRAGGGAADLVGPAGTIDIFCENWPRVKEALRFIASLPMVPQSVKDAIAKVIAAGDLAAGVICPR